MQCLINLPFGRMFLPIDGMPISYWGMMGWWVGSHACRAVRSQQIVANRLTVRLVKMSGPRQFGGIIRTERVVHTHIIIPSITAGKHLLLAPAKKGQQRVYCVCKWVCVCLCGVCRMGEEIQAYSPDLTTVWVLKNGIRLPVLCRPQFFFFFLLLTAQ